MRLPSSHLGAFTLEEPIATGGMGVVWRGSAPARRPGEAPLTVAVKVLSAEGSREPTQRAAFLNEVRAICALDHPNVVTLFDAGEVPDAPGLPEGITPGSPWMAMEYADQGTLVDRTQARHWEVERRLLRSLLEALAHTHARGVLHRDLKPSNVLIVGRDRRPKLSDFGLSIGPWQRHSLHRPELWPLVEPEGIEPGHRPDPDDEHFQWGTPAYMAPEQLREGELRLGPWTDLYALGCIAWTRSMGAPPFGNGPVEEVVTRQLYAPLPRLKPMEPVPLDFEAWVRRLLQKHPEDRYQRAADALADLNSLGDALSPQARRYRPSMLSQEPTLPRERRAVVPSGPTPPRSPVESRPGIPAVPDTWRPQRRIAPPPRPAAVGLGVLEQREAPLVGRDRVLDRVWTNLWRVASREQGRVVLLAGPPGSGRERVASFISQRAHELGVTHNLCLHLPTPTSGRRPWPDVTLDQLRQAARRRVPLVQITGDPHADGLPELLDAVLDPDEALTALVLVRCAPEDLRVGPLAELLEREGVEGVTLGPLAIDDLRQSFGEGLGLAETLCDQLWRESGGVPGEALRLLTAWAKDGVLREGGEGIERG